MKETIDERIMKDKHSVLMTAVVLHYNNGDVIYDAIDSVLNQDYPHIELIVSDDFSGNFDGEAIKNYIESNKGPNIERVVVRQNETNLGTVAHLEQVRLESQGEVELLVAADDCWHDEGVFSAFAGFFEEGGPDVEFVTSQIEMCDERLETVESLFVTPAVQQMLLNGDMQSLIDYEAYNCGLAGPGSAFRRSYFDKIGKLSEHYAIVEDWPAHVRWLRMGKRIYYLDRVTLKHRHGGISHSANSDWPQHYYSYRKDIERIYSIEIEPYKDKLTPEALTKAEALHRFNEALCCSLENRVSVLIMLGGGSHDEAAIDSAMQQNSMNYEVVIGCKRDQVEWIVRRTNDGYTQSPSIRRIRLVIGCEEDQELRFSCLKEESRSELCLCVPPGQELNGSSALLAFVYKEVTGCDLGNGADAFVRPCKDDRKAQKNSARTLVLRKRIVNFIQMKKIEEDLLYITLVLLALTAIQLFAPVYGGVLSVLLWVLLVLEAFLLVARVVVFGIQKITV